MGWRLWLIACLLFLLAAWRQPTNRAGSLSLAVVFGIFAAAARGADRMSRASLVPTDRFAVARAGSVRQRMDPRSTAGCRSVALRLRLREHAAAYYPRGTATISRRWTTAARMQMQPPTSVLSHRR